MKDTKDPLQKYAEQIRKTGFDLEFRTGRSLQGKGWSVISNKYYLDDTEDRVREIDLIAYKVRKVQHVNVFTSLVISCKKSADNTWVLLGRKPNLNDPNVNWTPLEPWSVESRQPALGTSSAVHGLPLKGATQLPGGLSPGIRLGRFPVDAAAGKRPRFPAEIPP